MHSFSISSCLPQKNAKFPLITICLFCHFPTNARVNIGATCTKLEARPQKRRTRRLKKSQKQSCKCTRQKIFCQRATGIIDLYTDRSNQQTGHSCGDCKLKIGVYDRPEEHRTKTGRLQTVSHKKNTRYD